MRRLACLVCMVLAVRPVLGADDLSSRIRKFIEVEDYKHAHWGILVVDAKTGDTLFEHNADKLFAPASVTKLYSCATALCRLGPDFVFETPVYGRGAVKNGQLDGDLILVASGDLTLGGRTTKDGKMAFKDVDHTYANGFPGGALTDTDPLAGLKELARQIKKNGIKRVTGDVLIDDRLFERARGSGSGPDLLTPIIVNDNAVDVVITPGKNAGELATIKVRPETSVVQVDARVETVTAGKPVLTVLRAIGPGAFTIRGQIPVDSKPLVRIFAVEDPVAFVRTLFIEALQKEGVEVAASPLARPQADLPELYDPEARVAVFRSPPLSEAIKVTLKVSHNLYASTLPILVAAYGDKLAKKSLEDGMKQQRLFLTELGLETKGFSFGGGAGGSPADMTSPRATVELMRAMAKRKEFPAYRASLPILGVDGTLATAVDEKSPVRGKVQAKTGTLIFRDLTNDRFLLRSKALAGVLTTARERELYVTFFVNDVPLPKDVTSTREGKALGKLCEIIHEHCP